MCETIKPKGAMHLFFREVLLQTGTMKKKMKEQDFFLGYQFGTL